jgi:hypothetical protein
MSIFPYQLTGFPMRYLGIPLSVTKLPKLVRQPLIDQVVDRLPVWKGSLMNHASRLTLIKSTLSALLVYVPSV